MRLLIEHKTDVPDQHDYAFWCPACKHAHVFTVGAGAPWSFDGNFEKPGFAPSLKTVPLYCHLYVSGGLLQYCADSKHELAGQTIPMVDWETILPAADLPPAPDEEKPTMTQIDCAACGGTGKVEAPASAAPAAVDAATKKLAIGYIASITGDRANAEAMSEKIGHARVAQACKDGKDPFHLGD
jgi:uncharacterized protein DUF6527